MPLTPSAFTIVSSSSMNMVFDHLNVDIARPAPGESGQDRPRIRRKVLDRLKRSSYLMRGFYSSLSELLEDGPLHRSLLREIEKNLGERPIVQASCGAPFFSQATLSASSNRSMLSLYRVTGRSRRRACRFCDDLRFCGGAFHQLALSVYAFSKICAIDGERSGAMSSNYRSSVQDGGDVAGLRSCLCMANRRR
jgi:hypothetical protein